MTAEHDWLSLDPGEDVVWIGQPRVWRIVGTAAGAFVLVAIAVAGAALAPRLDAVGAGGEYGVVAVWAVAGIVALSALWNVAVAYLRVQHTDYVLTNRRIYRKTGILSETVTSVGVDRVQNTTLRKDVTGNLFDYGTVSISTAGSGGADLSISDLDDPESFRDRLQEQVRAAGERDGDGDDERPDPAVGALDEEAMTAVLAEARRLRAVAERMEERV
ncbi:PH domain-containing protein [Halosimplex salinum]|uniref:PH domain-containing protein n=1 Tax=Halosimplex salinum TaxID=1710538 RepID=UPI000F4883FB|nr:PH domain-containing protein [Halosimplex salinum]